MSYLEVWKKIMSEDDSTKAIENNGKDLIIREFKNDPSYRNAILQKLDLTEKEIDIRLKNVERTTSEKKILFLPDENIEVGSIVKCDDKAFLIKEFEDNSLSPYGKALLCNQTLNWKGLDKPIPCWCDNSSYGTKGVISTTWLNEYDGKILFYTQYNEKTAHIKQDMRFIFDNNKDSIYKVVDINRVVTGNVLRLVMDKTEYQEGKDDLVNNIAYNDCIDDCNKEEVKLGAYGIKSYTGLMEVKKWDINMFTVVNENGVDAIGEWNFEVNLNGNPTDAIIINEKGSNYIKFSNNGYIGIEVELICTKDDIRLTQIIRLVR